MVTTAGKRLTINGCRYHRSGPSMATSPSALHCHFHRMSRRAGNIRVAGASDKKSKGIIADMEAFFGQPRYRYRHHWVAGDFLVFENSSILHGSTAIGKGGVRVLFRGQVNRRSDYAQ
ncbi:hypothetical protein BDV96DRAFT_182914 [Lophiotrema nucula]|uniref:TauD/TfdA-like domain-containing protein n=1 Tax=Lophiotrema nucula TaxID=690887 RepID=A0A6A5YXC2_9PLEO|nr:hypothetical protein BDV96DRAFT_182914 [Lophiotrema nucula]